MEGIAQAADSAHPRVGRITMAVSALVAGITLKIHTNTAASALVSEPADGAIYNQDLEQVRALMLYGLQGVMQGPASDAGRYQISTSGSLIRARLALASCKSFQCSREYALVAAASCELIHNASLVHDDLLDGDQLRRGQPTVWKKHGKGVALCAGDLLLCTAFALAAGLENAQQSRFLTQHLAAMTSRVIVGQSIEIAPRSCSDQPRFMAYIQAARAKTAPLIQLPLITGAVAANADQSVLNAIQRFADAVGLAYQIIDDLDDLAELGTDVGNQLKALHPFHAWHHHRAAVSDSPRQRILRATRHAQALLQRGRRQLECLEQQIPVPITPTLGPLLMKLEHRAQAHSHSFQLSGEQGHETNS
jgi:geranylgeranyl diphosphate synthase type II